MHDSTGEPAAFNESSFIPSLRRELATGLSIVPDSLQCLGFHQNIVFSCRRRSQNRILRLSPSSHRSIANVHAELDWIEFLRTGGFPAARPLPVRDGSRLEVVQCGGRSFILVCFEFLRGSQLSTAELADDLCRKWGSLVGLSHRLTLTYEPPANPKRANWQEMSCFAFEQYFPPYRSNLLQKCAELLGRLRMLSTSPAEFGLIHADLHPGNLVLNSGGLSCFDFDDSHYNWFAYDIATAIFFAYRHLHQKPDFLPAFLDRFMEGYSTEHHLSSEWMRQLPDFVRLRELAKCVIYHQKYILHNNLWSYERLPPRQSQRLAQYMDHLELDREYIPGLSSACGV